MVVLCVAVPILIALSHTIIHKVMPSLDPRQAPWLIMFLSTFPAAAVAGGMLLYFIFVGQAIQLPREENRYLFLTLGALLTVVYLVMMFAYRYGAKPAEVSLAIVPVPLAAVVVGYLLFGQWSMPRDVYVLAGIVIICLGTALVLFGQLRHNHASVQIGEIQQCVAQFAEPTIR